MKIGNINIKKILFGTLWVLVCVGCITLLAAAMRHKETKLCKGIEITIQGEKNNFFVDKNDVYTIIKNNGGDTVLKNTISSINLKKIEKEIENNDWIKNVELFFDNNNMLTVLVEERIPVARIFTTLGNTFYIDSICKVLPISNKFSARLPIFTNVPITENKLSSTDSAFLKDIKTVGIKIIADSFLMAMIEQIDVSANQTFELTPKIGTQTILFGKATDVDNKLLKIKLFYKNVIIKAGWNRYKTINLQYKNQVVASIRGVADVVADSLKTLQLMQLIAENAKTKSADSSILFLPDTDQNKLDSTSIEQSIEHEEENDSSTQKASLQMLNQPITTTEKTNKFNQTATAVTPIGTAVAVKSKQKKLVIKQPTLASKLKTTRK